MNSKKYVVRVFISLFFVLLICEANPTQLINYVYFFPQGETS